MNRSLSSCAPTFLAWDDHGYYEVSLDAGTLTLTLTLTLTP